MRSVAGRQADSVFRGHPGRRRAREVDDSASEMPASSYEAPCGSGPQDLGKTSDGHGLNVVPRCSEPRFLACHIGPRLASSHMTYDRVPAMRAP